MGRSRVTGDECPLTPEPSATGAGTRPNGQSASTAPQAVSTREQGSALHSRNRMRRQADMLLVLAAAAGLLAVTSAGVVSKAVVPGYIDCVSSADCGTTECCVLGTARFSIPSCQARGEVGDPCRPAGAPRNMSVSYLDGSVVQLVHVYSVVCACAPGLVCAPDSATCEDPLAKQSLNELDD